MKHFKEKVLHFDKPSSVGQWKDKTVLVTGATGSFGNKCITYLLKKKELAKVIVFSRDELKQHEMQKNGFNDPRIRYFIGDIRDSQRMKRAMNGVDIVIHAAALKQVPSCEYNPSEAILTNIIGTQNVIDAALENEVEKVLALSTDKAVNPVNLYGATKLCAEKLIIQSNSYSGHDGTKFSCVRYGNVVGSRGSVLPLFKEQAKSGEVSVTDPRMTRFWITLDRGVEFVLNSICQMKGGEIFVPKIPSMKILDLTTAIAPNCKINLVGIRPGEKLHEILIAEDESRQAVEHTDHYIVYPSNSTWDTDGKFPVGRLPEGFAYSSDKNNEWLRVTDIKEMFELGTTGVTKSRVAEI